MTRQHRAIDSICRPFANAPTLSGAIRGKLGLWGILWGVSIIFGTIQCLFVTDRRIDKPLVPQCLRAF
jgi:hypothetical protein